jgi:hypothetical protein
MFNNNRLDLLKGQYNTLMNRVVHWKTILTQWQVGTKDVDNGTRLAIQDLHDSLLRKQVKLDALVEILTSRFMVDPITLLEKQIEITGRLDQSMKAKFPGVETTDAGLNIDAVVFQDTKDRLGFPL